MLSKLLQHKVVNNLYYEIPEFRSYAVHDLHQDELKNYLVLDYFGVFLKDAIKTNLNIELIDKCYIFINKLCEQENDKIEAWLKDTFLESMIDTGQPREFSKMNLNGRALTLFEQILSNPFFSESDAGT